MNKIAPHDTIETTRAAKSVVFHNTGRETILRPLGQAHGTVLYTSGRHVRVLLAGKGAHWVSCDDVLRVLKHED